jgi:hypothetical protein
LQGKIGQPPAKTAVFDDRKRSIAKDALQFECMLAPRLVPRGVCCPCVWVNLNLPCDLQTLPLQVKAMRQYARRRSWKVVKSVEDVGSGAAERPQRQELIKAARRREIDVILVWRLDRWGRSLLDLIGSLQELSTLGVGFVSLCEALD